MTIRGLAQLSLVAVLLLGSGVAAARPCGDDVNGRDVPCRCGDTVVGNVVLDDDPVTTTRCSNHGLIIGVSRGIEAFEIDLNGKTLRGSGRSSGLWVMSGGAGGARIVSYSGPAVVEGFRDGIIARTRGTVSVIDNVIAIGNRRDGIFVFSDEVQIRGCEARQSGRDGISVRGERWLLKNVRASGSRRHGIVGNGTAGTVGIRRAGVYAETNGGAGIYLMGTGHRLLDCVAVGGNGDGVFTSGALHEIAGCLALDNAGSGFNGTSSFTRVQDNRAERNGNHGLYFRGHDMQDAGGNSGRDNGRGLRATNIEECKIGGVPCR